MIAPDFGISRRSPSDRKPGLALVLLASIFLPTLPGPGRNGAVVSGRDSSAVPGAVVLMHRVTADVGEVVDSTSTDSVADAFRLSMDCGR